MARHTNRVRIHTLSGTPTYSMGRVEAERLKDAGELRHSAGRWYRTELQRKSPLSPVNLTMADMHGVVENRRRSVLRLKHWPTEHDTRAVTIVAGRGIFVPNEELGIIRAKLHEQASRARRYANVARN